MHAQLMVGLILLTACASSGDRNRDVGAQAPPTSFDIAVDATSVVGASLQRPYPGAALIDLRDGQRVDIVKEQDLDALEQPLLWIEPSDPEVHFRNVTLVTPGIFQPGERGGQLRRDVIKVGTVARVRGGDGVIYEVAISAYTSGKRDTAALTVRIRKEPANAAPERTRPKPPR